MNERIKELHNQACRFDMEHYPNAIPDGERIQQKFAELIVQECLDAVGDGPMQRPEIQRIKAKFGVEYYEPIEKAFRS
jgi:hypothetical protein